MKEFIVNGKDVSKGNLVMALEGMLKGISDNELRESFHCYKWDEQFYEVCSEIMDCYYMIKREFNCLIVWYTTARTSFNGGDDIVQKLYHPLCIISEKREYEHQNVTRDIANGLIRLGLLQSHEFVDIEEEEE